MGFRQRLLILIPLVVIFVLLAPYLILYSQGYRYDFGKLRFTRTGNIFVSSSPREATVIINRRAPRPRWYEPLLFYKKLLGLTKLSGTTPTTFNNLLPDNYLITVKKEGYQTWEKKLDVKAEETTPIKGIQLFLNQPVIELAKERIDLAVPSLDQKKIILIKFDRDKKLSEIYLFNSTDQSTINLGLVYFSPVFIRWAPSNNKFLISSQPELTIKNSLVFDLTKAGQIISLKKFNLDLRNLKWGTNDLYLHGQNNNLIYSLNLTNFTSQPIFNLNLLFKKSVLQDWLIKDNYLYWLRDDGAGNRFLEKHKLENSRKNYQVESLLIKKLEIPGRFLRFADQQPANGRFLVLTNKENFLILDTEKNDSSAILFNENGQEPVWLDKYFIFTNQYELWQGSLYENRGEFENPSSLNKELINRTSQPIIQAAWYQDGNYLIFLTENSLWAVELDNREKRLFFQLVNLRKINQFSLSSNPRFLYLVGENDDQAGLFKIKIQ